MAFSGGTPRDSRFTQSSGHRRAIYGPLWRTRRNSHVCPASRSREGPESDRIGLFWAHSADFSPRRGEAGPFADAGPDFARPLSARSMTARIVARSVSRPTKAVRCASQNGETSFSLPSRQRSTAFSGQPREIRTCARFTQSSGHRRATVWACFGLILRISLRSEVTRAPSPMPPIRSEVLARQ
jgi:hypothetical protein